MGEGKRLKAKGCNGRNGRDGGRNDRDGQGERAKEDQRNDMRPRELVAMCEVRSKTNNRWRVVVAPAFDRR